MLPIKNTPERFGIIAMLFHWLIAVLVIGMLILGLYMASLPIGSLKLKLYGWHKQTGVLIFMLVVLRLLWRLNEVVPAMPNHIATWQKLAARSVHFALYILLLAMPVTGWLMSSAAGLPVSFFGWFTLPDLIGESESLRKLFAEVHEWLAYAMIVALLAHVGAALQHHFIYKDNILRRMLP